MHFDLVIRGGRLLDPAAGIDDRRDIGIVGDRVAAIDSSLPAEDVDRVINATGRIVCPGLVDIHTHVSRGADYFGIDADSLAWRSGVTTWVDAGSAGAFRMPAFLEHVTARSIARIRALINVSYLGLAGLNYDEYCNPAACDVDVLERVAKAYPGLVVGIKTRMGREGVCYPGLRPLRKAIEAGQATGLPVMCHISGVPPTIERILELMRPGDIITHAYTGAAERLIDRHGRVRPAVLEARERGVRFDIGHGAGSFSFTTAEALAEQGFWPDTLSTDLHQLSVAGHNLVEDQAVIAHVRGDGSPELTLLTVMTKFLYLGWPLGEIIRATTAAPAATFGWTEVGSLRIGAPADLAILEIVPGRRDLYDIEGNIRSFDREFVCHATIVGGHEMDSKPIPAAPPWIRLDDVEAGRAARTSS